MSSLLTKQRLVTLALMLVGGIIVAGGTLLMFGADIRDHGNHESPDLAAIGTPSGSTAPGGATGGKASTLAAAPSMPFDAEDRGERQAPDSDGAAGGVARRDLVPSASSLDASAPVRRTGDSESGESSTDVAVPTTRTDSTSKGGKTAGGKAGADTTTDPAPAVVDRSPTSGTKPEPSKSGSGTSGGPKSGGTGGQVEQGRTVEINGSVSGLWPGHAKTLELKLENPNASLLRITEFAVQVAAASGPCTGEQLHFGDHPIGTTIPGRGERVVSVTARLDASAGNECAGATFSLTYSMKAEKA